MILVRGVLLSVKNKSGQLILASASPRRVALLAQIGVCANQIMPADIDESPLKNEKPRFLVERLAIAKARKIHETLPSNDFVFILAADTVVACGARILGKPKDERDALAMLQLLSGRRHRVVGGQALITPSGKICSRVSETIVQFKKLDITEIDHFIASNEWDGKAGSYGIQGLAAGFVKFIAGSYSNIVGLDIYQTRQLLSGNGYNGFQSIGSEDR